jgi:hypothetical protein
MPPAFPASSSTPVVARPTPIKIPEPKPAAKLDDSNVSQPGQFGPRDGVRIPDQPPHKSGGTSSGGTAPALHGPGHY